MYFEQPCRLTKRSRADANDGTWSHFGLPLGNGRIGAMLGGEVFQEVIQLNEESLINGGPLPNQTYHHGNTQNRSQELKAIQSLLLANQNAAATELCQKKLVGLAEGYGAYQNLGEIVIGYQFSETAVTDYRRELDLESAIHAATFNIGQSKIKRQTFISAVDQLFVHHFASSEAIQVLFAFQSEHSHRVEQTENGWRIKGDLSDNHLQFALELSLIFDEGELEISDEMLILKNCSEVTLIVGVVTDYAAVFPDYRRPLPLNELKKQILKGVGFGFNELKNRHLWDYQALFKRVDFQLFANDDTLPVNQIVAKGGKQLAELLYHFGRYLLLSSSRAGNLPSNLQGVWNETNNPPWGSDYHLNVNLQMNYWGAAGADLLETIEPLVAYVENLRQPGRLTAAAYHGIISDEENPENGFIAHTQTTPFGFTGPGWDFEWGWSPAAIPWILGNLYDAYLFSLDVSYLKKIYPMLKETTRFFEQALVYNEVDGHYYSAPAYSPEHGPITLGNVYEHSLIQQLILNTIAAAEVLTCDQEKVPQWRALAKRIRTEEIGAEGQVKEWFEETTIGSVDKYQDNHRHVSHLLGLYPMHRIQKMTTLATAAERSLEDRGLGTTGWSMIHRGLMWARLGDGTRVEKILELFLAQCLNENLFATHPPFQIDANLGYVALVQEALVQSQVGRLEVLPALPISWRNGAVKGIRCRGNLTVDLSWQASQLVEIRVTTERAQTIQLVLPNQIEQTVALIAGQNDLSDLRN